MMPPKRALLLKSLMTTTALAVALAVSTPALGSAECGVPVNGVVTCAASGSYTGIDYTGVTATPTINLDAGVQADTLTLTGAGDLTVKAAPGSDFSATVLAVGRADAACDSAILL